jgi:hypothetical protein
MQDPDASDVGQHEEPRPVPDFTSPYMETNKG